jgi:hypothetical protein
MNTQLSVSEIFDSATQLGKQDFDQFFKKISIFYARKSNAPFVPIQEAELLEQINQGFSIEKWERLQYLDWKMETSNLNEKEAAESLKLATIYEKYTVERLHLLIKLATLRGVSLDELMTQLGFNAAEHG